MYVYSFEKLEVWKESKKLTKIIYQITSSYPENEKILQEPKKNMKYDEANIYETYNLDNII